MLRRVLPLVTAATIGALVATLAAPQVVLSQAGPNRRTIVTIDRNNDDKDVPPIDIGRTDFSPGDIVSFRTVLYGTNQKKIGNFAVSCLVLTLSRSRVHSACDGTASFKDGKVSVLGDVKFGRGVKGQVVPIVGGTREFSNAGGVLRVEERDSSTKLTFDIRT